MGPRQREQIRRRARQCCEYCGLPDLYSRFPAQVDHVIATKHGGGDGIDNLAWSCFQCNVFKGSSIAGIDAESNELTPLFHPRRDDWSVHFRWNGPQLDGLTPIGRTTVAVLRINASVRVEHRRMLMAAGVLLRDML
jgi:hypothetical protein